MAGKAPRSRNKSTDTVTPPAENFSPDEIKDETMTETNLPDENVNPQVDDSPADVNSENNSDGNSAETPDVTPPAPVVEKFPLPDDPSGLVLSDDFAQLFGIRLLTKFAQIKEVDELLKAQAAGDTEAAVIDYAESDVASANIQAIYGEFSKIKAQLDLAREQLTAAVKTEKGDIQLTADELQGKKDLRKKLVTTAKHALVAYKDYAADNDVEQDVIKFGDTVESMIGRSPSTKSASAGGSYEQTTEIRPRINNKGMTTGYIEVAGEKFASFTSAIKKINKLEGGKDLNIGQIHTAWIKTAMGDNFKSLDQWNDIPKGTTTKFSLGTDNTIEVTVFFDYAK